MPSVCWKLQKRNSGHLAKHLPKHKSSVGATSEALTGRKADGPSSPDNSALQFPRGTLLGKSFTTEGFFFFFFFNANQGTLIKATGYPGCLTFHHGDAVDRTY